MSRELEPGSVGPPRYSESDSRSGHREQQNAHFTKRWPSETHYTGTFEKMRPAPGRWGRGTGRYVIPSPQAGRGRQSPSDDRLCILGCDSQRPQSLEIQLSESHPTLASASSAAWPREVTIASVMRRSTRLLETSRCTISCGTIFVLGFCANSLSAINSTSSSSKMDGPLSGREYPVNDLREREALLRTTLTSFTAQKRS